MSLSGNQVTRLWPYGGSGHNYGSFAGKSQNPPVFSGTIPDISHAENTGAHSYDLSTYFSGATSYSIAPAVETGWTFDTVTGELEIDTDDVGVFGTYVVTATNVAGSDDSNAFSVTVTAVESEASGGWLSWWKDEADLRRRKRAKLEALREETEQIEESVAREIARVERDIESNDLRSEELQRLKKAAERYGRESAENEYNVRVGAALERAVVQGNYSALEALEREMRRAKEEAEWFEMAVNLILQDY